MGVLLAFSRWEAKGLCRELDRNSSSPPSAVAVDMVTVCCKPSSCTKFVIQAEGQGVQRAVGSERIGSRIRFLDDDLTLRLIENNFSEDSLVRYANSVNVLKS